MPGGPIAGYQPELTCGMASLAVFGFLQDAGSVAGLLFTTEAMIAEAPKKETAPAVPGGGRMGSVDY